MALALRRGGVAAKKLGWAEKLNIAGAAESQFSRPLPFPGATSRHTQCPMLLFMPTGHRQLQIYSPKRLT
jgi:hypothetical protein